MIRWFFLLTSCVLAIALAIVLQGRWGHAQMLAPDLTSDLPFAVSPASGLLNGRADLTNGIPVAEANLNWTALAPEGLRLRWRIDLNLGDAGDFTVVFEVDLIERQGYLRAGNGVLELNAVHGLPIEIAGQVQVEKAGATLAPALRSATFATANASAKATGIFIGGANLGWATAVLTMPKGIGSLKTDVIFSRGAITGTCAVTAVSITEPLGVSCAFDDTPGLPTVWRRALIRDSSGPVPVWRATFPVKLPFL